MIDLVMKNMWSPLVLVLVILIMTMISYLIYRMGNPTYNRTELKGQPFISGNAPPKDASGVHVGGDNLFWGFTNALRVYFDPLVKGHTGIVNDYIYWFIVTMAVVLMYIYITL